MSSKSPASLSSNLKTSSQHKFWTQFFILYKNLPALWDKRCSEYKDRCAKMKAYDEMAAKLSELRPNSSRKDVLRQINIFRTNYRRERVRTEENRARCKEFRSSLWYYNLLSFLDTHEFKNKTKQSMYRGEEDLIEESNSELEQYVIYDNLDSNDNFMHSTYESTQNDSPDPLKNHNFNGIDGDDENEFYGYFVENELGNIDEIQGLNLAIDCENAANDESLHNFVHDIYNEDIGNMEITSNNLYHSDDKQNHTTIEYMLTDNKTNSNQSCEKSVSSTVKHTIPMELSDETKAIKNNAQTMTDEVSFSIATVPCHTSAASEILAKSWAIQYEEMSTQQKIYARKAISDILFAGCLGKLSIRQGKLSIETEDIN